MILYKSTRGDNHSYTFSEAILKGIVPDGGLFVPERIPKISPSILEVLVNKSYQDRALTILELFETDINKEILKVAINQAYTKNFDHPKVAPLIKLKDNQYIQELWHGPTSAFKDYALQLKPLLFSEAVKSDNQKRVERREVPRKYLILVATSGDTGKAVLEGYRDRQGISIVVFYPVGGVSKFQELSMTTQEGSNLRVFAVEGDFDEIQRSVKETFSDIPFNKKLLEEYRVVLSSANSINWGRLLPQIVYHVSAYADLVKEGKISLGDDIDIAVPTGNFGNILVAFYAKKMGLPVRRLICASNENNVLTEFLTSGIYDVSNRQLVKTPSPSMDIIVASNIERLLYEITRDPISVSEWLRQLKDEKRFEVDHTTKEVLRKIFVADWVANDDCLTTIKEVFIQTGYLMDPHTAVAQAVVERYAQKYGEDTPVVICSTAHFAKFASDVYRAISGNASSKLDEFKLLDRIAELAPGVTIPANLGALKNKPIRHKEICDTGKEAVEQVIFQYVSGKN